MKTHRLPVRNGLASLLIATAGLLALLLFTAASPAFTPAARYWRLGRVRFLRVFEPHDLTRVKAQSYAVVAA
jgi:hypothetical protein